MDWDGSQPLHSESRLGLGVDPGQTLADRTQICCRHTLGGEQPVEQSVPRQGGDQTSVHSASLPFLDEGNQGVPDALGLLDQVVSVHSGLRSLASISCIWDSISSRPRPSSIALFTASTKVP